MAGVVISVVFTMQAVVPYIYGGILEKFSWLFEGLPILTRYFLWVILVPLIYRFIYYISWHKQIALTSNTLHMLNGIVIAAVHSFVSYWLFIGCYLLFEDMDIAKAMEHIIGNIYAGVVTSYVELWVLLGLFNAINYYQKYQQQSHILANQEKELANAKLTAFRMQLHPHFLFNALNSVMSLIEFDKLRAKDMLVELSTLMRRLLQQDNRHTVTVKDELSFIKSYLELERLRFEDRLKITYDIQQQQYDALVPNLILQPIIENAIKHGFSQSTESCEIVIEIKSQENDLVIRIEDNGIQNPYIPRLPNSGGVGLKNVYQRLQQMFDHDFSFSAYAVKPRGFGVQLIFPLLRSNFS
jgi:sensor histidine kinase YesM